MYQFDESFLERMGLSDISEEDRNSFLEYAQEEFEIAIGEEMMNRLGDEKVAEFEAIYDDGGVSVNKWLAEHPGYESDLDYKTMLESFDEAEAKQALVVKKWLDANCPDYDDIIKTSLEKIEAMINENANDILMA